MSKQEVDSTATIQKEVRDSSPKSVENIYKEAREKAIFKENSQDSSGVVLFTTAPNNLNWRDVKRAFIESSLGWVERVDLIPSGKFKKAFIYIEPNKWNMESKQGEYEHLQQGNSIRVYYQQERFFSTRISRTKKTTREEAIKRVPRVRVEMVQEESRKEKQRRECV